MIRAQKSPPKRALILFPRMRTICFGRASADRRDFHRRDFRRRIAATGVSTAGIAATRISSRISAGIILLLITHELVPFYG